MRSHRILALLLSGGGLLLSAVSAAAPPKPKPPAPQRKPGVRPPAPSDLKAPVRKTPASPGPMSPQQVVDSFFKAQQEGDDERAYGFLSSGARQRFPKEKWEEQGSNVRLTFTAINLLVGDTLLVGGAANARNQITSTVNKGDTATINVTHLVPIKNTLRLVRENGQWKIDLHRSLSVDNSATASKPAPTPAATTPPPPATPPAPPDTSPYCQGNLRQLGNAFRVYALDHGGRLPDASKWTDELGNYLQSASVLKCSPDSPDESDFAMNSALSGARLGDIENPGRRILLYETTTKERNVSGTGATLPAESPRPKGYAVLYANGDVGFSPTKPVVK